MICIYTNITVAHARTPNYLTCTVVFFLFTSVPFLQNHRHLPAGTFLLQFKNTQDHPGRPCSSGHEELVAALAAPHLRVVLPLRPDAGLERHPGRPARRAPPAPRAARRRRRPRPDQPPPASWDDDAAAVRPPRATGDRRRRRRVDPLPRQRRRRQTDRPPRRGNCISRHVIRISSPLLKCQLYDSLSCNV